MVRFLISATFRGVVVIRSRCLFWSESQQCSTYRAALILGKVFIRGNTVYILEWYMILLKKLFLKNNCLIFQLSKISLCCKKIMWKLASDFIEYANETFEIYSVLTGNPSTLSVYTLYPTIHHIYLGLINDWKK